jgi:hypothetical protein
MSKWMTESLRALWLLFPGLLGLYLSIDHHPSAFAKQGKHAVTNERQSHRSASLCFDPNWLHSGDQGRRGLVVKRCRTRNPNILGSIHSRVTLGKSLSFDYLFLWMRHKPAILYTRVSMPGLRSSPFIRFCCTNVICPLHEYVQRGPKITSLVARSSRGRARNICMMYAGYMMHHLRDICARFIHAGCARPTYMLRAPAARGARNKGCYFWIPLFFLRHNWLSFLQFTWFINWIW